MWFALLLFLRPLPAWSDQVHLANGQTLEGIVVRQSDEQVVLQVAWQGYVVLNRASLTNIEPANEAERQQLLTQWQQEHQAFQEREKHRQRFEEEQHAKGLVLYQGRWVTQEELAAVRASVQAANEEHKHRQDLEEQLAREQVERKALREELQALVERLRAMQEEQLRLQQEVSSLRCLLARPRPIPIPMPPIPESR